MTTSNYSWNCNTCGHHYFSEDYKLPPCPRCETMLKLSKDLPSYIKDCIERAVDRLEDKLEQRISGLEWNQDHDHE